MNEDDHKGIASILNLPHRSPVKTPKVETQEFPSLSLSETVMRLKPLELPKSSEPKDEYGYTKKQNREIENYMTRPKLENSKILRNNINHKKKIGAVDYIEKVKENYNDTGSKRVVNKSLNNFENRTENKSVVTFDPTTQLFTDDTRNIAFKDYKDAKAWNDKINGQPTATGPQVNYLKARLDNAREFGHDPDKKDNRKQEMKTQTNKHRRLI
jgi:hypothetical protein